MIPYTESLYGSPPEMKRVPPKIPADMPPARDKPPAYTSPSEESLMYDYVAKPRPPRKLTPLPPQGKEKTTQGVRPGYDARQGNPWPLTLFIFYHYGG